MTDRYEERRRTHPHYQHCSNDEPMPKSLGAMALGSLVLLGACKLYDTVKEAITGKKKK